ncbi:MAG: cytidylate kinase-like family protein, partial [Clostridia bacterium]|nr:cytidylate kinase-like family protein [Clostridia bacterium]
WNGFTFCHHYYNCSNVFSCDIIIAKGDTGTARWVKKMKVITINREYGAGGHSIGMKVAEKLGIEFYDKDIIKASALELGITAEEIKAALLLLTIRKMLTSLQKAMQLSKLQRKALA